MGESARQTVLIKAVQMIKAIQLKITKRRALEEDMMPAGISLMAVLGFNASKLASRYRLKAIAALLAKTIHAITRTSFNKITAADRLVFVVKVPVPDSNGAYLTASTKPIIAKGIAKMVCENLTRLR